MSVVILSIAPPILSSLSDSPPRVRHKHRSRVPNETRFRNSIIQEPIGSQHLWRFCPADDISSLGPFRSFDEEKARRLYVFFVGCLRLFELETAQL
jgi:hypothetical protein